LALLIIYNLAGKKGADGEREEVRKGPGRGKGGRKGKGPEN
jgi:hypothetical protein